MKKVLLVGAALVAQIASPALAADRPAIPSPYEVAPTYEVAPPPAVYSWWTGCYLGAHGGGAWGRPHYTQDNSVVVEPFEFTPLGGIGGGQLGCQYQWNSLVFGLEGTYSWASIRQGQPSTVLPFHERSIEISQIGTVAARFGYAWDRTMLYAKAGWAGVRISARAVNVTNGEFADFTTWSNGWTAGVGMEYVPWQNIVVGVEADVYGGLTFDHAGVDNFNVPFRFFNSDATIWAITVRASYLFGPTIVTRYVN